MNSVEGGGAERVFVNIANDFHKKGFDVSFLLGNKRGVYLERINAAIPVAELKTTSFLGFARRLPAFFKGKQFTHVFTASDYVSAATVLSKRSLPAGAKLICTLHYDLPYNLGMLPFLQRTWVRFLNRAIISKADKLIAVSHGVAAGFATVTGKERPQVIYNPVFDESIHDLARESDSLKLIPAGARVIVSAGRLDVNKNHRLLINAFSSLLKDGLDLYLIIMGEGLQRASLEQQAKDLGIGNRVILPGFIANPFPVISHSNLFVLSSLSEGLPTVLIESLALGINVVSTDCPSGPAEILEEGAFGWLAINNNTESLKEAMNKGLTQPMLQERLIQRAGLFHKNAVMAKYVALLGQ